MKKMRVGIDARFYGLGRAGLARYTQELIYRLSRMRHPYQLVALIKKEDAAVFRRDHPKMEVITTTIPHYSFREQVGLAHQLKAANLDLMHFTNFNLPAGYHGRFVVTIHDLTLLTFAGRSRLSRLKILPMRRIIGRAVKRSQAVVTISEYQRDLIAKTFQAPPDHIRVIYNAVDDRFRPLAATKVKKFREDLGLTGPFVMYTGQWRQHKNLVRLFKAFAEIQDKTPAKLVLVGKVDPAFPIIQQTVRELGLTDRVVFTDFVDDEQLPLYYNAADLFAFPSLSEGFGLPPLEAMACGTTVASSSAPPMPEILDGAAAYFDPNDTGDMARTLLKLLREPKTRERYRKRGFAQAKRYSWERTAKETLAVYREALR